MTKGKTVPVTMRALIQRINRKLAKEGKALKAARGESARQQMGNYYVIDVNQNFLVRDHVDPEAEGRDLGVLQPWESVEE
jgi:hypothetical protein